MGIEYTIEQRHQIVLQNRTQNAQIDRVSVDKGLFGHWQTIWFVFCKMGVSLELGLAIIRWLRTPATSFRGDKLSRGREERERHTLHFQNPKRWNAQSDWFLHFLTHYHNRPITPLGVIEIMSLTISQTLTRLRPVAKTCMTVGLYMGFGDLLMQKVALRRDKL